MNNILRVIEIEDQSEATELCNARNLKHCKLEEGRQLMMEEFINKQRHALQTCVMCLNRMDSILSEKDFYFASLYQEKRDDEIKYGSLQNFNETVSENVYSLNIDRVNYDDTDFLASVLTLITKFESKVSRFVENVQLMYSEVIILQNNSIDTERTILDLTETISLKEANIQQFISRQADSETNNFLSNIQASVHFENVKKTHSKLNKVIAEKDIEIASLKEKLEEKTERIEHLSQTIAVLQSRSNILLSSQPENNETAVSKPDVVIKTITLTVDSVCNKLASVKHQFTSMFQDRREGGELFSLEEQQQLYPHYDHQTLQRSVLRLEMVVDRKLADMQEICNEIVLLQNHFTMLDRTIADLTESLALKEMDIMHQGLRDSYNAASLKRSTSSTSPVQPIDSCSIDEDNAVASYDHMLSEATQQYRDQLSLALEDYAAYAAEKRIANIKLTEEIAALRHQIEEKDTELLLLGADYRQLLQRFSESEERILQQTHAVEAALSTADGQRKELETALADRDSSLLAAVHELKRAVDVSTACEGELKEKEKLIDLLTSTNATLEDNLSAVNGKLLRNLEAVDGLSALLRDKESTLSALNEELDSAMLERNLSDANVDELRRRNAEVEDALAQQQSVEKQLRSQLSDKDIQINLLAAELATTSRFLEDLNFTVETLDRDCMELSKKIEELQSENKTLEEKYDEMLSLATGKDTDLAAMDAELVRLKETLSANKESYDAQSKQLELSQKHLEEISNINSGLQDLLNSATAQVIRIREEASESSKSRSSTADEDLAVTMQARVELLQEDDCAPGSDSSHSIHEELMTLERDLKAHKEEHARLIESSLRASDELQLIESDFSNASVVIERLQSELVKATSHNATLMHEVREYKEENSALRESLSATTSKLSILEVDYAAANADMTMKQEEKVNSMRKLLDDQQVQIDSFLSEISSAEKLLLSSGRRDMNGWSQRDTSSTNTVAVTSPIEDRIPSVRSIIEQIQSHVERLERDNSKLYLSLAMKESDVIQLSKELESCRGENSPKNVSKKLNFEDAVDENESFRSLTFDLSSTTIFEIDDASPDRAAVAIPAALPFVINDALNLYMLLLSAPQPEEGSQPDVRFRGEEEAVDAALLKALLTTLVDMGRVSASMDAESIVEVLKSIIDSLSLESNDQANSVLSHVSSPKYSEPAEHEQETSAQEIDMMSHSSVQFFETVFPATEDVAELEVAHLQLKDFRSNIDRQNLQVDYLSLQNANMLEERAILIDESEVLNLKAEIWSQREVNSALSSQQEHSTMWAEDLLVKMQCLADKVACMELENMIIVQENAALKEDLQAAAADISSIESFVEAREGELSRSASALAAAERDIVSSLQERERVQDELTIQNRTLNDCHQRILSLEANITSLESDREFINAQISELFRFITKDNFLIMSWVDRVTPLVTDFRDKCAEYKETLNIANPLVSFSAEESKYKDENHSNNSSIRLEDLANMRTDSSSPQGQLDLIRTIVSAQNVETKGLCETVLHLLSGNKTCTFLFDIRSYMDLHILIWFLHAHTLDAKFCLVSGTHYLHSKSKEADDLHQQKLQLECQILILKEAGASAAATAAAATIGATEQEQSFTSVVRTPRLGSSFGEQEKV